MFWLDDDSDVRIDAVVEEGFERWRELAHCSERRRFFLLVAGESLQLPPFPVDSDTALQLSFMPGLPEVSADGLTLDVRVHDGSSGERIELMSVPLGNAAPAALPQRLRLSLDRFAGRDVMVEVACGPGPAGDPSADWLAFDQLVLGPDALLPLGFARAGAGWRAANEIAHFASVYDHAIYRAPQAQDQGARARWVEPRDLGPDRDADRDGAAGSMPILPEPLPGENANAYAHRALGTLIPRTPPDFVERLRRLSRGAPVRMMSICSGAARIEAQIVAAAGVPVELTLVDMNRDLLEQAARQMPANADVRLVLADANRLPRLAPSFDVAVCVSGLHHLVELEHVLKGLGDALRPGGELWSIGEQVGRNGSRLWPDDHRVADALFRELPQKYRHNRNTGSVDAGLPNADCSAGCFEGIRSEELLGLLDRYFLRDDVYLRNVFLWRFVDLAYVDNFRLDDPEDRDTLQRIVLAEFARWQAGGHPSELHGVYERR